MTIASQTNRVSYTGNGVSTAFAVSFPFQSANDLVVIETIIATGVQTTKTITTHYTVSGTPDTLGYYPNGGTVTAVTAPASTVTWTIYRAPSLLQSLNLSENNALPAESLEAQLDYLTMLVQRLNDRVGRSLRQPEGDSADIDYLPAKVDRASTYMAFDADGDPIATDGTTEANPVSTFMATVLDDATAADARTTLGVPAATSGTLTTPTFTSPTVSSGALTMTSGQIAFPATQAASADANTLDDYEEGLWTPSVGGTATYTAQVGRYTKIGRQVTVTCQLTINAIGTGSTVLVSGLPFAFVGTATGAVYFTGAAGNYVSMTAVTTNTTDISFATLTAAGASTSLGNAVFQNGTMTYFSLTYFV